VTRNDGVKLIPAPKICRTTPACLVHEDARLADRLCLGTKDAAPGVARCMSIFNSKTLA